MGWRTPDLATRPEGGWQTAVVSRAGCKGRSLASPSDFVSTPLARHDIDGLANVAALCQVLRQMGKTPASGTTAWGVHAASPSTGIDAAGTRFARTSLPACWVLSDL